MIDVTLTVNGRARTGRVEARTSLGDFLRETLHLTGTHLACEHGVCGACTILVDGRPNRSCILSVGQANGREITTIEGFDDEPVMDKLRGAFSREHGLQCGYCTPGMLITGRDIVLRLGDPGEDRVRAELAGNLCRCTGYVGIVKAIRAVGAEYPVGAVPEARKAPRLTAVPATAPAASQGRDTHVETAKVASDKVKSDRSEAAKSGSTGSASAPAARKAQIGTDAAGPGSTMTLAVVVAAGLDETWSLFRDLPRVAACVPGAELTAYDASTFEGRVAVALGPIRASVGGRGTYAFDDASHTGAIGGSGQDRITRSRVKGDLQFALRPLSADSTELSVTLAFDIQGPLAQFSRSAIVKEFTARLLNEFAAKASALITGASAGESPQRPVPGPSMIRLMLSALWNVLFRKR